MSKESTNYPIEEMKTVQEICARWIPVLYKLEPEQRGYKAQAQRFLTALMKESDGSPMVSQNAISRWLSKPDSRRYRHPGPVAMAYLNSRSRDLDIAIRVSPLLAEVMSAASPKY